MESTSNNETANDEDLAAPLSSYSMDELHQLNTLLTQSYDHYMKLLKDEKIVAKLKEGDLMALNMCLKETLSEMDSIKSEIESRIPNDKSR
jgi:hypothetical protein